MKDAKQILQALSHDKDGLVLHAALEALMSRRSSMKQPELRDAILLRTCQVLTLRETREAVHTLRLRGAPIVSGQGGFKIAANETELIEWLAKKRNEIVSWTRTAWKLHAAMQPEAGQQLMDALVAETEAEPRHDGDRRITTGTTLAEVES